MLPLILLLACAPDPSGGAADLGDDTGSGGVTPTLTVEAEAVLSEAIDTVVLVSWESEAEGEAAVDYGDRFQHRALAELGEDGLYRATLVGFPRQSVASFRVRHGEEVAEAQSIMTGEGAAWLPRDPDVTGEGAEGFVVTGFRGEDGRGALILDRLGRIVWWHDLSAYGADAYTSRATLSPDKDAVWYSIIKLRTAGADADAALGIVRVSLDGTEVEHRGMEGHHHDFWLHDDGRVAFLSTELEDEGTEDAWSFDDLKVLAPDGSTGQLWSTSATQPAGDTAAWLNHIEYVAETDTYWIGAKSKNALYVVDASSGETLHTIGHTAEASVTVDEPFYEQHGFDVIGDELLLFDNGVPSRSDSRALRFSLDLEAGTATTLWEHSADPPLYTPMLGDALQLPEGRVLLNWTSQSHVAQVTPDGEVLSTWDYDDFEMLTFMRFEEALVP